MKSWFRDNLKKCDSILGTFDIVNGEYNVTLNYNSSWQEDSTTVSFNEGGKGWVSFKSFIPKTGVSVSGKYWTSINNKIYEHYHEGSDTRNTFYGNSAVDSTIKVLFNDMPSSIKSFKTINYEGSQAKVDQSYFMSTGETITDAAGNNVPTNLNEYYNLTAKSGWYVSSLETDMQSGRISEFINKENKWFNKISGNETSIYNFASSLTNSPISDFTVQGIGQPSLIVPSEDYSLFDNFGINYGIAGCTDSSMFNYNPNAGVPCNSTGVEGDVEYDASSNNDCCEEIIEGCMDVLAVNYNEFANTPCAGCCEYFIYGCTNAMAFNYNPLATVNEISALDDSDPCCWTESECTQEQLDLMQEQ